MRHHRGTLFQPPAADLRHLLCIRLTQDCLFKQALHVPLACGRQGMDLLIHQRLGNHRFIRLVVTVTPVTDQVDNHILVEMFAILKGDTGNKYHSLRVVTVNVEHRYVDHPGYIAAVEGRACITLDIGGKTDLVIDDDVHRATGLVTPRLGKVECLCNHSLARECSVTVYHHRQHTVARAFLPAVLAGTYRTLHDRAHNFQMRRVKCHGKVNRSSRCIYIRSKPLVIFHVAGTVCIQTLLLEFPEQQFRRLSKNIDQHIQAATVCHAKHDFLYSGSAGMLYQVIE